MSDADHAPQIANRQSAWVSYMLYDHGYVSQEKAAELAGVSLRDFRAFIRRTENP